MSCTHLASAAAGPDAAPLATDAGLATVTDVLTALRSLAYDGASDVPQLDLGDSTAQFSELAETVLALRSIAQAAPPDVLGKSLDEMLRSEMQLRLAALATEHAALTMTIFDRTGRYIYANRLMCELTGYGSAELTRMHVWDTAPQFTLDTLTAAWDRFGPVGEMHVETVTHRKDGTTYPIDVAIASMSVNGRELGVAFGADITDRKAAEERTEAVIARLGTLTEQVVSTIALIVEARDPYTAGHQARVSAIAVAIAQELGLDENAVAGLCVAGKLHDVGKTAVPSEILSKPGALSPLEFSIVKEHASAGHAILAEIDFPWPVAEMVWQHHERLDGSGYPRGLAGSQIMREARILAVADVVEAMSAHRPYRPGLGLDAALEEIERGAGTLYDPEVVQACIKSFREGGFELT